MLKRRRLVTVLSLAWESPYVGKMVFILRRGPGLDGFFVVFKARFGAIHATHKILYFLASLITRVVKISICENAFFCALNSTFGSPWPWTWAMNTSGDFVMYGLNVYLILLIVGELRSLTECPLWRPWSVCEVPFREWWSRSRWRPCPAPFSALSCCCWSEFLSWLDRPLVWVFVYVWGNISLHKNLPGNGLLNRYK